MFESLVVFENYPMDAIAAGLDGALRITGVETLERTNYPLTLIVLPGESIAVQLSYDSARFSSGTARRILLQLETVLRGMADGGERALCEISLLGGAERDRILKGFNQNDRPDAPGSVLDWFAAHVDARPEATAVRAGTRRLNYGQLALDAQNVAAALRARGIGPETRVGVFLERSPELVTALLGVLASGGVYVPLDPSYPAERLQYIAGDANAAVVLTEKACSIACRKWAPRSSAWMRSRRGGRSIGTAGTAHIRGNWPTSCTPPDRPDVPRAP